MGKYIYIIGVSHEVDGDMLPIKRLKYFMEITDEENRKGLSADMLAGDKLFKCNSKEADEVFGIEGIRGSISTMRIAAKANDCTMHLFNSEGPWMGNKEDTEKWFEEMAEGAAESGAMGEYYRKLLIQSKW